MKGSDALKAAWMIVLLALFPISNARADDQGPSWCRTVLSETTVKLELVDMKTTTSGKWSFRQGVFHVTNLGAEPITLAGVRKKEGVFEVDDPYSQETIKADGTWQGTNGIPGTFLPPPDTLVIPPHSSGDFETSIEPTLPEWDPGTTFYIVISTSKYRACMVSAGFTLQPRAILERMGLDAKGKLDAEVCPTKAFDQDVVIRFIKKQKFDFGPYAEDGSEDLGVMEIENHRQTPIPLHGERHGDYFYIPNSRVLVQQHLKSGKWETGDPMLPATVRYPLDTLMVPAGGKATFVAEVDTGPLYAGWDRTDRAVLADPGAKVCAVSQGIYEPPDRDCGCSGSAR